MPEKAKFGNTANGSELQPHKDYFYFDEKSLNVNKFRFENYVQIYRCSKIKQFVLLGTNGN